MYTYMLYDLFLSTETPTVRWSFLIDESCIWFRDEITDIESLGVY